MHLYVIKKNWFFKKIKLHITLTRTYVVAGIIGFIKYLEYVLNIKIYMKQNAVLKHGNNS